jgi:integrase
LTVTEARLVAREMLVKVAAGQDPSTKPELTQENPTVDDLWERVERDHYNRNKDWDKEAKRLYTAHLKPKLGRKKVRQVCYDDIKPLHEGLRATPIEANHVLAVISKMLNLAEVYGQGRRKWRPINSNPCAAIKRFRTRKRKRKAAPDEIAAVGARLEAELAKLPPNRVAPARREAWQLNRLRQVAFLYLLIFSGARPSEIVRLEPPMIERWTIEGKTFGAFSVHGKTTDETGEDRRVFLPPQAMAIIDHLPREGIARRHRNGKRGRRTVTGLAHLPRKMWARVKPPGMWARDWRRTFGSVALSNGIGRDQIGELLGHLSTQTTAIYSKLYEANAVAAASLTAERLDEMLKRKAD